MEEVPVAAEAEEVAEAVVSETTEEDVIVLELVDEAEVVEGFDVDIVSVFGNTHQLKFPGNNQDISGADMKHRHPDACKIAEMERS